jgi:hypothetical protein
MKTYGEVVVEIHVFLTPYWLEVSGQRHALAAVPSGKEPPVPIG